VCDELRVIIGLSSDELLLGKTYDYQSNSGEGGITSKREPGMLKRSQATNLESIMQEFYKDESDKKREQSFSSAVGLVTAGNNGAGSQHNMGNKNVIANQSIQVIYLKILLAIQSLKYSVFLIMNLHLFRTYELSLSLFIIFILLC
jgi:hypothetical protein